MHAWIGQFTVNYLPIGVCWYEATWHKWSTQKKRKCIIEKVNQAIRITTSVFCAWQFTACIHNCWCTLLVMDKTTDDSFFIKLFQNYLCHLLEDLFFHLFLRAYVSNAAESINQSIQLSIYVILPFSTQCNVFN